VTRPRLTIAVALAVLAATASRALPQDAEARAFVVRFVDASNSKSIESRRALLHPKSLPCASTAPEAFYVWMVTRQLKDTIPADYTWKLTPLPPGEPLMFADKFDYPVRPTHTLQLDFNLAPPRSKTMVLQLVHEGNRWFEMTPCPKPETIVEARAARQAEAKRAERVQALVAAMSPELKGQLLELLRAGRRLDASKHYQAASGEDTTTAVEVLERLSPR
jgi:hypothetical protein